MKSIVGHVIFAALVAIPLLYKFKGVVLQFALFYFVMGWMTGAIAMYLWPITERSQQYDDE